MRQFYLEYCMNEKIQPLVGEISWSHNIVIMSRCKDPLQREFYSNRSALPVNLSKYHASTMQPGFLLIHNDVYVMVD
ncbi:DUF1016 N-terminal domain-containing protein [Methanocalculus sp.]|uniref:DUF1016 N-terminal domain-containing protein n=1 Tax=Methanocalculus sp. TaxID=2004547 RepID=UPI00351D4B8D